MIKLKCACGATTEIEKKFDCDERVAAEDWLIWHDSCRAEYWMARDKYIKELEKDIAFYRSCINCGETPAPGDEPSARYAVVSPPTIGATENDRDC